MKTVSFTGHRHIGSEETARKLHNVLELLAEQGADVFCAGGATGFDMLAAQTVIKLKEEYPWISLVLILPCPPEDQSASFSEQNRELYFTILAEADRVETISSSYTKDCMKKRNQRLIDLADICVCCYDTARSNTGTGQTVRMAEKKGIEIINLFDR